MNNPFQTLMARPRQGQTFPVGTFVMSASPIVAEAIGCAGFDWAVIDMEHAPLDLSTLVHMLQAVAGTAMLPITRVPHNDTVMLKRVLDAGAQTVLIPFVQDAGEARKAVAACQYPPAGVRGMAAMSRGSRFGTTVDYLKTAGSGISVIVQIETLQAMAHLEEIAQVDGIASIFIGPSDLSGSMGFVGDLLNPAVVQVMAKIVERCHALGKPIGTVGGTPETVALYRKAGFDYIGVGSDLGLLMGRCAGMLSAIRPGIGAQHAPSR
ncbi:HpcH/HpaI aldolase family protein [Verminephrobacter eiseniae]|uniref:HpcH/HpaI aldolase family protein n=1 Tax=Verminephrobacter eiseniae TaxID=364317 RepID=UPI002237BF08|nr:aldolase/citrate lyase family protein [Verminephrobacter eiseniae]